MRLDTRTKFLVMIPVLILFCCIIAVQMQFTEDEDNPQLLLQILVVFGPAVLAATISLLLSFKHLVCVELVGPSLLYVTCSLIFRICAVNSLIDIG